MKRVDFPKGTFYLTIWGVFILGLALAAPPIADATRNSYSGVDNPGINYYQSLPKKKREEIKIIDDHTVEVSPGPNRKGISSAVIDVVRSIPVVREGQAPLKVSYGDKEIFRQEGGFYTYDKQGKNKVIITANDVKKAGGKIRVAVAGKEGKTSRGTARIRGFRSARFGMSEEDVRKAAKKDFNISSADIKLEPNPIEKTTSLVMIVDNLLPDSGKALVVYIFGYKSRKLIQVNLRWGKPANPKPDIEDLVATANLLRNYFVRLGFAPDKVALNVQMSENSILVFRGIDNKGSVVSLILNNPQTAKEENIQGQNASLQLLYVKDPDSPDIFILKKGLF